jgi:hypothetical protein
MTEADGQRHREEPRRECDHRKSPPCLWIASRTLAMTAMDRPRTIPVESNALSVGIVFDHRVIPAQSGNPMPRWMPAFAGMTRDGVG